MIAKGDVKTVNNFVMCLFLLFGLAVLPRVQADAVKDQMAQGHRSGEQLPATENSASVSSEAGESGAAKDKESGTRKAKPTDLPPKPDEVRHLDSPVDTRLRSISRINRSFDNSMRNLDRSIRKMNTDINRIRTLDRRF